MSYGQEQEQSSDSEPQPEAPARPIEEITVVGEPTFHALRMEIDAVETDVYNLFNELNGNDEFDVTCTDEVYVGSYFTRRTCMAAYLREAQADNTQRYLQGIDVQLTLDGVKNEVHQKTVAMEAEMLRIAQENPEFAAALQILANLLGIYEAKKKENPFYYEQ